MIPERIIRCPECGTEKKVYCNWKFIKYYDHTCLVCGYVDTFENLSDHFDNYHADPYTYSKEEVQYYY